MEIIQRAFEMLPNTAPFDVTGHPSMSVPCGLSDVLPAGMMLTAKHFDEVSIYRAASAFEKAGDWMVRLWRSWRRHSLKLFAINSSGRDAASVDRPAALWHWTCGRGTEVIAEIRNTQTVVVLALCLLGIWLAAESALAQEVVEKPTWSVGDWWEIGRYRFTVSNRNEDRYEMIRTPNGRNANLSAAAPYKVVVAVDGWISERIRPDRSVSEALEDKKHDWVRFPLTVGSEWVFYVLGKSRRGKSQRYDYECRAVSWEELQIAGNSVRTLRIACQSWTRSNPKHRADHTVWYAPEAKRYIKLVSHYTGGPTFDCSAWSVRP